jgi:transposase
MWTVENRGRYERRGLRYPTDLTDEEWALTAPHIRPAKRGGRPRTTDMREVVWDPNPNPKHQKADV